MSGRECPACRTLARKAGELICSACRARVDVRTLGRLRGFALAVRAGERGARARYDDAAAAVVRTARAAHLHARQLALFSPNAGRVASRRHGGD